jgi:hypothetical protein
MALKAEFPDRPMTAAEVTASLRGELACVKQTFYFAERWQRTEIVSVEATDEDEAWNLVEGGEGRFVSTLYEDECTETDPLKPGDEGYPS